MPRRLRRRLPWKPLIPDPSDFDLDLLKAMMNMASLRRGTVQSQTDRKTIENLAIEDYLNSTQMMPRDVKIRSLVNDFGMPEEVAAQSIDTLDANAEASPLTMLQPIQPGDGGQLIQFRMSPNYEMSLFTAQVTGSVIVTDSESRWIELQAAQHRQMGLVFYPWNDIYEQIGRIPMDYHMLKSYTKTQQHFASSRAVLKHANELVLTGERDPNRLRVLRESAKRLNEQLEQIDSNERAKFVNADCRILAPDGGIYDSNVQRLLVRSGCLKYDNKVRSIHYVGLKL